MNAPRDLSPAYDAIRTAELQADAAMHGETVARAAVRRARMALDRGGKVSGGQWRGMSLALRQVLLSLATDRRDVEAAAITPWEKFSDAERLTMGSLAREWRRQLEGAAWLR